MHTCFFYTRHRNTQVTIITTNRRQTFESGTVHDIHPYNPYRKKKIQKHLIKFHFLTTGSILCIPYSILVNLSFDIELKIKVGILNLKLIFNRSL